MRSHLVLAAVTLVALAAGCSSDVGDPVATSRSADPSSVATGNSVTPPSAPATACDLLSSRKVSKLGSGFVVELNIMSALSNPAWRLSEAEGVELRKLLGQSRGDIDTNAPDKLGGFGVTIDRDDALRNGRRLKVDYQFWVQGDSKIRRFLGRTVPCNTRAS